MKSEVIGSLNLFFQVLNTKWTHSHNIFYKLKHWSKQKTKDFMLSLNLHSTKVLISVLSSIKAV